MAKVKLAVWGITDSIWGSLKDKIDPRRAEIVFFLDNNADRIGGLYASRPVYCFSEIEKKMFREIDYIVVAAYSGYKQIRENLLRVGYQEEKIQLYITPWITMYNLGDLSHIKKEYIDSIYFEPRKRWNEIQEYIKEYAEIFGEEHDTYIKDHTGKWYEKESLISHACGGFVNGKKVMYSNSKEALEYTFSKKFRLIECDVLGHQREEVILAHDFDKLYEAEEVGYTCQTFEEMLQALKNHPKVHMLVDVKWSEIEEYDFYISHIMNSIDEVAQDNKEKEQLYKQIIMEVYDEESIQSAQKAGFDVFFTQYRNDNVKDFLNTIKICEKYKIGVVGYDLMLINEYKKAVALLKERNIKIYVYSTNSKEEYRRLKEYGVDGVFTDYLTYEDLALI